MGKRNRAFTPMGRVPFHKKAPVQRHITPEELNAYVRRARRHALWLSIKPWVIGIALLALGAALGIFLPMN